MGKVCGRTIGYSNRYFLFASMSKPLLSSVHQVILLSEKTDLDNSYLGLGFVEKMFLLYLSLITAQRENNVCHFINVYLFTTINSFTMLLFEYSNALLKILRKNPTFCEGMNSRAGWLRLSLP